MPKETKRPTQEVGIQMVEQGNGVIMLTFPPHCSHKLQPLDRSVYGPLKRYYNIACNAWQLNHAGIPMTIYDIAENLSSSYPKAFTPENIMSGFRVTGICPFNNQVFKEDEFLSSFVTDRQPPQDAEALIPETAQATVGPIQETPQETEHPIQETPQEPVDTQKTPPRSHISPEEIRPYPKAAPRKPTSRGRKKVQSMVLTDTPNKERLQTEIMQRKQKSGKTGKSKLPERKKIQTAKAVDDISSSSSSDEEEELARAISSDSDMDYELEDTLRNKEDDETEPRKENLKKDKYVLVKYATKKSVRHFVGLIIDQVSEENTVEVKFLVRQPTRQNVSSFVFPENDDIDEVDIDNIIAILTDPMSAGGTKRSAKHLIFHGIDFHGYSL